MSMFRRQSWLLVLAVVVVAALLAYSLRTTTVEPEPVTLKFGQLYPESKALNEFALLDQDGEAFTGENLQGLWSFVFFGYTTCPDICPMTLSEMARLQAMLPEALRHNTQFLFVTVDPERDTVEQLHQYLPFFNAEITGLTGSTDAIASFARQMGVASAKIPQEGGSYLVDHSVRVFLLNPEGERYALFSPTVGSSFRADELMQDYQIIRQAN